MLYSGEYESPPRHMLPDEHMMDEGISGFNMNGPEAMIPGSMPRFGQENQHERLIGANFNPVFEQSQPMMPPPSISRIQQNMIEEDSW